MKTLIKTPFKIWKEAEAKRLRISFHALQMHLHRGQHPKPPQCQYHRISFKACY